MSQSMVPIEGGLYVIADGERYGILKVLKFEEEVVHVRIYKNKYDEVPGRIDFSTLTLGTIDDADGFGIGHTPLKLETFASWRPQFLQHSLVDDEELEGYRCFKDAGGGPWE